MSDQHRPNSSVPVASQPYPREVRLGLVLFGGISLAIYMNGIALEFFNAVRGRRLYGFLKEITHSEITVDIISGTSAGGINGLFLAFALANNIEFKCFSKLWEEQGAVGKLIGRLFPGKNVSALREAVLDREFYYQPELLKALEQAIYNPSPDDKHAAPPFDIDLFITGTNFSGEASTIFDDAGHPIDLLNYRTLFRLKHRKSLYCISQLDASRVTETKKDWFEALSKLAAITSCFPAAFEPVRVDGSGADDLLRQWGELDGQLRYFIDGGVLANKPFTPTIDAIFRRVFDGIVDRYLCYVEPDPELLLTRTAPARTPSASEIAAAALTTLPRYQSISGDLHKLADHNSSVEQHIRLCKLSCTKVKDIQITPIYYKARFLALTDRVLLGIFRQNGKDPLLVSDSARRAAAHMVECFEELLVNLDAAEILADNDIYFRRRRLTHLSYWLTEKLIKSGPDKSLQEAKRIVNSLNKVLEAIQDELERLLDVFEFCWECSFSKNADPKGAALQLWGDALNLFSSFLVSSDVAPPPEDSLDEKQLASFKKQLCKQADLLIKTRNAAPQTKDRNLLHATDALELRVLMRLGQVAPGFLAEYEEFETLDNLTFPAELASGLVSKDLIRTVRFSPLDAKIGACAVTPKVLGRQAGAFGAFFKKDWRKNDIFFGRLDGACQLTELLLGETAKAAKLSGSERSQIRSKFLDNGGDFNQDYGPQDFFPHCDPEVVGPAFRAAINGCWNEQIRAALIEAEHHEIYLESNLPQGLSYGGLTRYLENKYQVRKETLKTLRTLASVPVAAKVAAAVTLMLTGLVWRGLTRK